METAKAPTTTTTVGREAGTVAVACAVEIAAIGATREKRPTIHVCHDKVGTGKHRDEGVDGMLHKLIIFGD